MRGVEEPVSVFPEQAMEAEQGGGSEDHRSAEKTTRVEKEGAEPNEQPIGWAEVGG